MAYQPIFRVDNQNRVYVDNLNIAIPYNPRESFANRKRRLLKALTITNTDYNKEPFEEISTTSKSWGVHASAFNLKCRTTKGVFRVENLFQSAKHFEHSGCQDLLRTSPLKAKLGVMKLNKSENIDYFEIFGTRFPNTPHSFFYNWLYIKALVQNPKILQQVVNTTSFSDINFAKGFNCQAQACAIASALYRRNQLQQAIKSPNDFMALVYQSDLLAQNVTV